MASTVAAATAQRHIVIVMPAPWPGAARQVLSSGERHHQKARFQAFASLAVPGHAVGPLRDAGHRLRVAGWPGRPAGLEHSGEHQWAPAAPVRRRSARIWDRAGQSSG